MRLGEFGNVCFDGDDDVRLRLFESLARGDLRRAFEPDDGRKELAVGLQGCAGFDECGHGRQGGFEVLRAFPKDVTDAGADLGILDVGQNAPQRRKIPGN